MNIFKKKETDAPAIGCDSHLFAPNTPNLFAPIIDVNSDPVEEQPETYCFEVNGAAYKFTLRRGGKSELEFVCPDVQARLLATAIAANDFYKILANWKNTLLPIYKGYADRTGGDIDDFCNEVERGLEVVRDFAPDECFDRRSRAYDDAMASLDTWREQHAQQTAEIAACGAETIQTANCTQTPKDCDSGKGKRRGRKKSEEVFEEGATFDSLIQYPDPDKLKKRLHVLIDKCGTAKRVGVIILKAFSDKLITDLPNQVQFESEFPTKHKWNSVRSGFREDKAAEQIVIFE